MSLSNTHVPEACKPIRQVLERVGDKWSLLVIYQLSQRKLRFNELRRAIPQISQRMLTYSLRELERDGLVLRTVTPSVPPRVDYELTALGATLLVPVQGLVDWAVGHQAEMEAARSRFDGS
ncbi:MAG: helix-turn-helix transcriptional regulator [Candidatus Eremiobacteraeota bacterium]|nr:helix-turn-helix transcriptional regulator [Candidatus Eremiobacteraeota bacterium]MCW5866223.1 helix-turn-helix transcriptional regulator [Candidatus Eremiobacteraeota bacterium]